MPRLSNIEVLQQIEQPILYIENKTNMAGLGDAIGGGFMKISEYLKELGEVPTDIPFVAYPNYEALTADNITLMVGFHIAKPLPEKDDIKLMMLPQRKVIFCMYRGKYEDMAPVYGEMIEWIKNSEYEDMKTSYEYYYNGPDTPEENLLTKIIMPLE